MALGDGPLNPKPFGEVGLRPLLAGAPSGALQCLRRGRGAGQSLCLSG